MNRTIFVALGTGVIITSAAALDIGAMRVSGPRPDGMDEYTHAARTSQAARADQRARIEARYLADRGKCAALAGFQRDKCLVRAHATKGRALLEAAQPYEVRL